MQFKWLMFDADNTLLDFSGASKQSLWQTFEDNGHACNAEIYAIYKKVNGQIWSDFEQGKITAEALRPKRFAELFKAIDLYPASPENFSKAYLENLIYKSEIYDGVKGILKKLKPEYHLSIITNGLKEVQRPRLRRLDIDQYFDSIIVSDEVGVAKPDKAYFDIAYSSIENPPPKEQVLVIGDSLKSDILGGLNYGFKTCWINPNQLPVIEGIEPDYQLKSAIDIVELLIK